MQTRPNHPKRRPASTAWLLPLAVTTAGFLLLQLLWQAGSQPSQPLSTRTTHVAAQLPRPLTLPGADGAHTQAAAQQYASQQQQQQTHKHHLQHATTSSSSNSSSSTAEGVCVEGRLTGSRKVYWRHLDGASPALMDVLHAEDRLYGVFNLKQQQNCVGFCGESTHVQLPWGAEGTWTVTFPALPALGIPQTTTPAQPLATDGHGHTLTIHAPIPRHYADAPTSQPLNVTIRAAVRAAAGRKEKTYADVPLCLRPARTLPYHLTACTGILPDSAHLVPEWVAYHCLQGVQHFVVYVDGPADGVTQQLQPLIAAGLLTVVDFNWPASAKRNWYSQQAIQNSCLMHARGQSRWLALTDVDEFLQVMAPAAAPTAVAPAAGPPAAAAKQQQTVAEFLHARSSQEHLAAFAACMFFFGSCANSTLQAAQAGAGRGLLIGTYTSRAQQHACEQREKLIVNPHSTAYVSVHVVTTGGEVRRLDPATELRLAHYKLPESSHYPVEDTSLAAYAGAVRSKLDSIQQRVGVQG